VDFYSATLFGVNSSEAIFLQYIHMCVLSLKRPEVEFLDLIGTKVLRVSLLLCIVTSTNRFYPHPFRRYGLPRSAGISISIQEHSILFRFLDIILRVLGLEVSVCIS
jgi:hypothetical protein